METAFKFRQRMKNLPPCAQALRKTLNLVISRCCLAKDVVLKFYNARAEPLFFLIKAYCLETFLLLLFSTLYIVSQDEPF